MTSIDPRFLNLDNLPKPAAKSVTRRRKMAADVKRKAAAYVNLTMPPSKYVDTAPDYEATAQQARVLALLWIIAKAQQALHLETRGALGDPYATPSRVLGINYTARHGADGMRREATPPPCTQDTE